MKCFGATDVSLTTNLVQTGKNHNNLFNENQMQKFPFQIKCHIRVAIFVKNNCNISEYCEIFCNRFLNIMTLSVYLENVFANSYSLSHPAVMEFTVSNPTQTALNYNGL